MAVGRMVPTAPPPTAAPARSSASTGAAPPPADGVGTSRYDCGMVRVVLLVTAEVAAVAGCHALHRVEWLRIGWDDPVGWLTTTAPADVLAAALLVVVTALSWWLLASTCAHALAFVAGAPAAVRATAHLVAPAVRRVIAGAVVGATLTGPVHALEPPVPPHAVEEDAPVPTAVGSADRQTTWHVVRPGESLWSIAAGAVERDAGGRAVTDGEVGPYWLAVVDANRQHLRSADPDLIFPGERIVLPPRSGT